MRLALLLLLLPTLALSQTNTGLTLQVQGQASQTVSGTQCDAVTSVTWSLGVSPCSDLVIWASTSDCGEKPDTTAGDFKIATISQATLLSQTSGSESLAISDLPLGGADGGAGCGAAVETTVNLCAAVSYSTYSCLLGGTTVLHASPQATIVYDAVPPPVPTIGAVTSLDSGLRVDVQFSSDTSLVDVRYREQGTEAWLGAGRISSGEGGLTLDQLTNDVAYEVEAKATDAAGNQSEWSASKAGTPAATSGFWRTYKEGGGTETGGCGAAGAGGLLSGVLVLLGLLWRKR